MHESWCQKSIDSKSNTNGSLRENVNDVETEVNFVIKEIVDSVCKSEANDINNVENKKKGRCGADKHRLYDNHFKCKVIMECDHSQFDTDVAFRYGIDKSLITKWKNNRRFIIDAAVIEHKKLLKKNRPSTRHKRIFIKLNDKFVTARLKGLKVSFAWLYVNANKIYKQLHANAGRIPKSAITTFIRLYKVKLRRVQRKKQVDRSKHLPDFMKFHTQLREGVIKSGNERASYDAKWGRFAPNRRFNVDQVPMPFIVEQKKTYDVHVPKTECREH